MKPILFNFRPILGWVGVLAILAVPVFSVSAATDIFLKLGTTIKGESMDKTYSGAKDGWIDVLGWSWGASNSGSTHVGGGAGAGMPSVKDLSVTKYVDSASPDILLGALKGTRFPAASLHCRKAGETQLVFLKLELKEVLVNGVSTGGSGGEDRFTETVSLNFASFQLTYTPQLSSGGAGTAKTVGWDIVQNVSQ